MSSLSETERLLERFLQGYLECALWSSTDERRGREGRGLDRVFSVQDIRGKALEAARRDCYAFLQGLVIVEALDAVVDRPWVAGGDFWLTRNGHGAGYWDGDYELLVGEELTRVAKTFGECSLQVSRGRLYFWSG